MSNPWPKWVGIPYVTGGRNISQGIDCYGLVIEVFRKDREILLPAYDLITPDNLEACADAMVRTELYGSSLKVTDVAAIEPYDLLLFNSGGVTVHIGVAIDKELMLHTSERVGSVIENYKANKWKSRLREIVRITPPPL